MDLERNIEGVHYTKYKHRNISKWEDAEIMVSELIDYYRQEKNPDARLMEVTFPFSTQTMFLLVKLVLDRQTRTWEVVNSIPRIGYVLCVFIDSSLFTESPFE